MFGEMPTQSMSEVPKGGVAAPAWARLGATIFWGGVAQPRTGDVGGAGHGTFMVAAQPVPGAEGPAAGGDCAGAVGDWRRDSGCHAGGGGLWKEGSPVCSDRRSGWAVDHPDCRASIVEILTAGIYTF